MAAKRPIRYALRCSIITFHRPVVHGRLSDQSDRVGVDPLPEHHVLVHVVRLHLAFHLDVEDLQSFGR